MRALEHFGVVGAGAWGTALAAALSRAGRRVTLWAREPEVASAILARQENTPFLPGVLLDPQIQPVTELGALAACDAWLLVTPVQHTRQMCQHLAGIGARGDVPLVGFFAAGEIARHHLYGYTGVLTVFTADTEA